jgi:precorrin-6A/cobalt-precorrin-6A reductase
MTSSAGKPEKPTPGSVLVLGGTAEGRILATELVADGVPVVSSLAGRVTAPRLPPGPVRIGGFGGPDGLAEYLVREGISAVVDATHPFAARITGNAVTACARAGRPLLVLRRPAWTPTPGDRWRRVPDLPSAAAALAGLAPDAVVLLTVGRQEVSVFSAASQHFWLRAVDAPDGPLPARTQLILDRGPFTVEGELALLHRLSADVLVTKNSGGAMTVAKLTAARRLALPVIMVDRPSLPPGVQVTGTVGEARAWAARQASFPCPE